jgi:DNA-directed RNA polymerase specialized sigma24 family protein
VVVRDLRAVDPAEVVVAWEAVEEILSTVPEGEAKDVLRLVAAGLGPEDIAERLRLAPGEVEVLTARGRIRVLTAALAGGGTPAVPSG